MFYKHSNIGGRIQSSDATAYNPAGLRDGEVKDSGFVFGDMRTQALTDGSKNLAAVAEVPKNLVKTRELQKLFLVENGVPIHLKRGARDVLAYRGTMGLCAVGMAYWSYLMYRMSYGIK